MELMSSRIIHPSRQQKETGQQLAAHGILGSSSVPPRSRRAGASRPDTAVQNKANGRSNSARGCVPGPLRTVPGITLNLLSDQPRFAQCKGLDAGSFIRRASRKPSNTAKYLQSSRHRSSLIRSLSSSISRSSAPNSLLSSCRVSSTACFSFLMVFTIPARTSRASGDLSIPEMVSFSVVWRLSIRCCRICQALPDSPLRRRSSNCDEMRASSLSVSRPHDPSGRLRQ